MITTTHASIAESWRKIEMILNDIKREQVKALLKRYFGDDNLFGNQWEALFEELEGIL